MHRILRQHAILILITLTAVSTSACSNNKDATTRALRSQASGLSDELKAAQEALQTAEKERDDLASANQALTEKVAYLEQFNREESARQQALRLDDAALASRQIRALSDDVHALRREIERREDEKQSLQSAMEEQARSLSQLEGSLAAERKQVARLESEKTTLAEELRATRKSRAKVAMIMSGVLIGSVIGTFVVHGRKTRESHVPETPQRFQTGAMR